MAFIDLSSTMHHIKCWFILFSILHNSIACHPGVSTFGVTSPFGSIQIIKGDTLTINCTINEDYTGNFTSKDIRWKYNNTRIIDYEHVTVLDERIAQLNIKKMNLSDRGSYVCYFTSKGDIAATLCNNEVTVAGRLQKPLLKDFKCISKALEEMTCTWKTQYTGVTNKWNLQYRHNGGYSECQEYTYLNDDSKGEINGCHFSIYGKSGYPIGNKQFLFKLNGENNVSQTNVTFAMDHYSRVIAPVPQGVAVYNSSSNEIKVKWDENSDFRDYKIPLVYRVWYKSEYDPNWAFVDVSGDTKCFLKDLIPFAEYSVVVRCRVNATEDAFEWWSQSVNFTQRVRSTAPTAIVQMSSSVFDDVNADMSRRNITIFWTPLKEEESKGANFRYVIHGSSKNEANLTQVLFGHNHFSATFNHLKHSQSYEFTVRAVNDEGEATNAAEIHVAKTEDKLADVNVFRVISFENGTYEVSWNATDNATVEGYVVLYCKSKPNRPDVCEQAPEWTEVGPNWRKMNITLSKNDTDYGFAVSAKGHNSSSGLVWAKCTTHYSGGVRKIKMKPLEVQSATQILVKWEIDCTEQYGIINGFHIAYCVYNYTKEEKCNQDELQYRTTDNNHATEFLLNDLKPNTNYSVMVTAKLSHNQIGEPGDYRMAKTLESAPENPPDDFQVSHITNNTVTVKWVKPQTKNGVITRYEIECERSKRSKTCARIEVSPEDSSTKFVRLLQDLHSFNNYSLRIKACVKELCSDFSNPINVTTLVGVPEKPEILYVKIENSKAIVQWKSPRVRNGLIDYYYLTVASSPKGINDPTQTYYHRSRVFSNMSEVALDCSSETHYKFRVQAVNVLNGTELMGNSSIEYPSNGCTDDGLSTLEVSLIAGSTIVAAFLITIGCFYFIKYVQIWKKKWSHPEISFPRRIEEIMGSCNSKMNGNFSLNNNYKSPNSFISSPEEGRCSASSQMSTETTLSMVSETEDVRARNRQILDLKDTTSEEQRYAFHTQRSKDSGHDSDSVISRDSVFLALEQEADPEFTTLDHNVETYHIPHPAEKPNIELHLNPRSLFNSDNSELEAFPMTNYSQVGLAQPSNNYVAVNNAMTKAPNSEVHAGYSRVGQMVQTNQNGAVSPEQTHETVPTDLPVPNGAVGTGQPNETVTSNRPAVGYVMAASFQTGNDPKKRDANENLFINNVRDNAYLDSGQFDSTGPQQGIGYVSVDSRPIVMTR